MQFFPSFVFLACIFYAKAEDDFVRRCKDEGIVDVTGAFSTRISAHLVYFSNSLSRTYVLCLEAALNKNSGLKVTIDREELRRALKCHIGQCVDTVFSGTILAEASTTLSGDIQILRKNPTCTEITPYRRGALNSVAVSVDVSATLNPLNLRQGPLTGILNNIIKLLADTKILGLVEFIATNVGLDSLLNGLILSVSDLLYGILGNIENLILGININVDIGLQTPRKEIFTLYHCNFGTGVDQDYKSCTDLNIAIDVAVSNVGELKANFDKCCADKLDIIVRLAQYSDIIKLSSSCPVPTF